MSPTCDDVTGELFRAGFPRRHVEAIASGVVTLSPGQKATAEKVAAKLGRGSIVGLIGPRGTGKTLTATFIAGGFAVERWGKADNVRYLHTMDVFLRLREAMRKDGASERAVIETMVRPALLVLDEIQERGETEWENRTLNVLLDKRYGQLKDTLLLGNIERAQLTTSLGASIVDRMREGGGVVVCSGESKRGRDDE